VRASPVDPASSSGSTRFNSPRRSAPNGVSLGYGRIYGRHADERLPLLDAATGKLVLMPQLVPHPNEGSTYAAALRQHGLDQHVPETHRLLRRQRDGIVLGARLPTASRSGRSTRSRGPSCRHPKVNSGGGLWYPPAVDALGGSSSSVANPAPLYARRFLRDGTSHRTEPLHSLARRSERPRRGRCAVPARRSPRRARLRP